MMVADGDYVLSKYNLKKLKECGGGWGRGAGVCFSSFQLQTFLFRLLRSPCATGAFDTTAPERNSYQSLASKASLPLQHSLVNV